MFKNILFGKFFPEIVKAWSPHSAAETVYGVSDENKVYTLQKHKWVLECESTKKESLVLNVVFPRYQKTGRVLKNFVLFIRPDCIEQHDLENGSVNEIPIICLNADSFVRTNKFGDIAVCTLVDREWMVYLYSFEFGSGEVKRQIFHKEWDQETVLDISLDKMGPNRVLTVVLEGQVQVYYGMTKSRYEWDLVLKIDLPELLDNLNEITARVKWITYDKLALTINELIYIIPSVQLQNQLPSPLPVMGVGDMLETIALPLIDIHPYIFTLFAEENQFEKLEGLIFHLYTELLASEAPEISIPRVPLEFYLSEHKRSISYNGLFDSDEAEQRSFHPDQIPFILRRLKLQKIVELTKSEQKRLIVVLEAYSEIYSMKDTLDSFAKRFVFFALLHFSQSNDPLPARILVWGQHSDSQQHIVNLLFKEKTWKKFSDFGFGFWLKDPELLKICIEDIARLSYQSKTDRDPTECSLFYLAMKKKNILLGLWRTVTSHSDKAKMLKFLSKDFTQEENRVAACKNAFVLLGKQRFTYAAAFFILAGRLRDACGVCFRNLNDFQLAIVLCRLEGDLNTLNSFVTDFTKSSTESALCAVLYQLIEEDEMSIKALLNEESRLGLLVYDHLKSKFIKTPFNKEMYQLPEEARQRILNKRINQLIDKKCSGIALASLKYYPHKESHKTDLVKKTELLDQFCRSAVNSIRDSKCNDTHVCGSKYISKYLGFTSSEIDSRFEQICLLRNKLVVFTQILQTKPLGDHAIAHILVDMLKHKTKLLMSEFLSTLRSPSTDLSQLIVTMTQ